MERGAQVREMNTDLAGLLVGQASMEARQAALALQMLEAGSREEERIRNLNEKIETLEEKLDERHQRIERLLEALVETMKPVEQRVQALEHAKSKATGVIAAAGGGTVALSGVVAWLTDLLK